MYSVFTDFHHASLLNSLIMLFEDRLDGKVYRPIGTEWHEEGYWKIYDHPATVQQFLGLGGATPVMPEDGTRPLNEFVSHEFDYKTQTTVYNCKDIETGGTNKAITFRGFMSMHFDIVIASIPQHIEPFRRLCNEHPSHPKLIYQIGNAWNISDAEARLLDGVMASARVPFIGTKIGYNGQPLTMITYHQEFDLSVFNYDAPRMMTMPVSGEKHLWPNRTISSFVNCFSEASIFQFDWAIFQAIEAKMTDFSFYSFGGQCRDGAAHGIHQLADRIKDSRFIWHTKYGGDGYGHIIHNAAACGRPLIVRREYYWGKMAEDLLVDGVTCIAIDGLSIEQIIDRIKMYNEEERYIEMSRRLHERFKEVVNFDAEFEAIKSFLQVVTGK